MFSACATAPTSPRMAPGRPPDLEGLATKAELAALREELRAELRARLAELAPAVAPAAMPAAAKVVVDEEAAGQPERQEECSAAGESAALSESIWDASIFIGMPQLGGGASLMLVLGLLTNICIQAVFIIIIRENLVGKRFSDEDLAGLQAFRSKIAHDSRYVAEANGYSLADRVCNQDLTLELATEQVGQLAMIRAYRGGDGGLSSYFQGPVMCLLAMAVWIMCILKEATDCCNLYGALRLLPRSSASSVVPVAGGGLELEGLHPTRKALALLMICLRTTVALVLLWIGAEYLCFTTSIGDLLLNAVALEMVIHIDELVYSAMAPVAVSELIGSLQALPMRPWPSWRGADAKAVATPVVLVAFLTVCGLTNLRLNIKNLSEAEELLCGGNTSFSFSHDGLKMVQIEVLQPFGQETAYATTDLASRAVMEAAAKKPPEAWDYALLSSKSAAGAFMDQASQAKMVATVSDIYRDRVGLFPSTCHNGLDVSVPLLGNNSVLANQWRVWPNYLQQALKLPQPPRGCSELAQHCLFQKNQSHLAMAMVRALCPVTCGCNSLQHGTMFVAPEMGCPAVCLSGVPDAERDGPSECVDTDPSSNDPRGAAALSFWAESRRAHGVGKGRSVTEEDWRTIGCDVATSGQDICVGDTHGLVTRIAADAATPLDYIKLLTFLCPVRCNCNGKRAGAVVPPGTVCPSICICPWRIPQPISEFEAAPSCRLPNTYWGPGNFFPNVSTDARCCFLMHEWMYLVQPLNVAGSNFSRLSYQNRLRYVDMDQHICHRCRSTCLSTLVELVARATFQNTSVVRTWFCVFPE